jgi:glycosyltransferase involved in cell wall biosynthesis
VLMGLGALINRVMPVLPILRRLALTELIVLRPRISEVRKPSLSIVIPARNERGNVEGALARLPKFEGADVEVIFVEGHSTDGTWEEIQRVLPLYSDGLQLSAYKQPGKGKADAVRLGFAKATKQLLVILDADLSVPPELLTRFYDAYRTGLGDFVNGSRLLYPIEGKAMKFLNKLGNVFFAKALSKVLGAPLSDSLCGTKLFSRDSYERFCAWRRDFGDFDPFGDFELLFPAAILNLGIIDVPIRYRDRLYGQTNIRRFYHGIMLLRMTLIGFFKIALGRVPEASVARAQDR